MSQNLQCKIMLAGQKGGVGKSAVTRALAVALINAGHDVCVRDYDDGQLTVTDWANQRAENGIAPIVCVSTPKENSECPVQIFDCPGWSSEHTRIIAASSDIIVLPSGPSTADDLTPTINLAFELEDKGTPLDRIMIVLNRIHNKAQADRARAFIRESDENIHVVEGEIRESTHVASLHDHGMTVLDIKTDRDRVIATECIQSIVRRIEELGPRADLHIPKKLSLEL